MDDTLERENILEILKKAAKIDSHYELFGANRHKYKLNPPIEASFVRKVEQEYGFRLPDDYFRFITEIGDGGAGPDYGTDSFTCFLKIGPYDLPEYAEKYKKLYRRSVSKPLVLRQATADEVDESDFAREAYEREPDHFFVYCGEDENEIHTAGFFAVGERGCGLEYGVITAGEYRGQMFDTGGGGIFVFLANSFNEFYQQWLNTISDTEAIQRRLESWRAALGRNNTTK